MYNHGGDIYRNPVRYDFSANLNFLGMPPAVSAAAARAVSASEHYPDPECRELREALAGQEGFPVEGIRCGNGAADLIYQLVLAEKPSVAVIGAPGFHEYEQALSVVGCEIRRHYFLEEEEFRYTDRILELLTEDVDLLILCSPNNPTGQPLPPELLERILERCHACGIRFLLDECFTDFLDEPERYSAVRHLGEHPELAVLKAFTKLYAMAGLRLGYILTRDRALLEAMDQVRQPWNVSVPAQAAGIAALGEEAYRNRLHRLLPVERRRLTDALDSMKIRWYGSMANYIFFRTVPGLREKMLEKGILIRDCSNYEGLGEGWYRIAVRSEEENREMIRALRELMG